MKNKIPFSALSRSMGIILILFSVGKTVHTHGSYPNDGACKNAGGTAFAMVIDAGVSSSPTVSGSAGTTQGILREFNLTGEWAVNVNNNQGYLTFVQEGYRLTGKILGDDLRGEISDQGVVSFTRSGANQDFIATVSREPDNKLKLTGTFDCPNSENPDLRWVALMISKELPVTKTIDDKTAANLIQKFSLSGEWGVNSNNNKGYLTFSQEGKTLKGNILGDGLEGEVFADGTARFTRKGSNESYTGALSLEPDGKLKLTGTFSCPTTNQTGLRWIAIQINDAKAADENIFATEAREIEARQAETRRAGAREIEARQAEAREIEAQKAEARQAESREIEAQQRQVEARQRQVEAQQAEARRAEARQRQVEAQQAEERPTTQQPASPATKLAEEVSAEKTIQIPESAIVSLPSEEAALPDFSYHSPEGKWIRDDGLSLEIVESVGIYKSHGRSLFRRANMNPGDLIFRDITYQGSNTWSLYVLWAYSPDITIATAWSEKSTLTLSSDGSTLTVISEFRNPSTNELMHGTRIYQRANPIQDLDE